MVYTLQERTEIIFIYGPENRCPRRTARAFNERHPEKNISHRYVIALIWKFEETAAVCNKTNDQPRKLDIILQIEVLGYFINEPITSIPKVAAVTNISVGSIHKVLKMNKFFPYKMQIQLNEDEFDRRVEFCEQMSQIIEDDPNLIQNICFSDKVTIFKWPLDVSFFGPLKTYDQAVTKWLKNHPGWVITQFQIADLFSEVYGKAATITNALGGFSSTGICPLNSDIFPDHLFSPAAPTDRPLTNSVPTDGPKGTTQKSSSATRNAKEHMIEPSPLTAPAAEASQKRPSAHVTQQEISPIPSGTRSVARRKRTHEGSQNEHLFY
ncbi:hypothetical protein ANN_00920 [Periplaneta americana]|uniref:DUF4817 domain-containing protein n=1 Tax=Periplaneta americana TaxID=6978 RepID=A0ABQ8TW61_PERAM|nr:hypothetical protein ANN_00920 [Periplaneta americana]